MQDLEQTTQQTPASQTPPAETHTDTSTAGPPPTDEERAQQQAAEREEAFKRDLDAAYNKHMSPQPPETEGEEETQPVADEQGRLRDPKTGRFVSDSSGDDDDEDATAKAGDEAAAGAEDETTGERESAASEEETETDESTESAIEPPRSWPRAMKANWDKFSPEQQEFIAEREKMYNDRLTEQGRSIEAHKPFQDLLTEHKSFFDRSKMTPPQVFDRLLKTYYELHRNPAKTLNEVAGWAQTDLETLVVGREPLRFVAKLVREGKVSNEELLDFSLGDLDLPEQQPSGPDPQMQAMQTRLDAIEKENAELRAKQQQTESPQGTSEEAIAAAIKDMSSRHDDFEELSPLISTLLPKVQEEHPHLTPKDWLTLAYDGAAEQVSRLVKARIGDRDEQHKTETEQLAAKTKQVKQAAAKGNGAGKKQPKLTKQQEIDAKWAELRLP